MDGNRRDSGCRPFFARCNPQLVRWKAGSHGQVTQMTNLSGERRGFTDECDKSTTCPVGGGFSRTSHIKIQLVRCKAGFHGRMRRIHNLSGRRRVFTDRSHQNATCPVEGWFSRTFLKNRPILHAGDDLHYEKKQGRAAVGK